MKPAKAFTKSILWRGIYFLSVLLLNIFIARHFKAEGSGKIYYITNIFSLLVMLLSFSLEVPMGYYLSQKKISEVQLGIASLFWIVVIMMPGYAFIQYFSTTIDMQLSHADFSVAATAFLGGNLLITFFVGLFYAKLDFVLPNIVLVFINLLLLVLIPDKETVKTFLGSTSYIQLYFLGFFIQGFILAIIFFIRHVKWKGSFFLSSEMCRQLFGFASIALLTNFMSFLMYRIDYFFVNKYCLPADLGNYIQTCKLAQLFFVVPAILAGVIFPLTASGQKSETNEKIQILSRGLILIYGLVCFTLVIIGSWLFPFVFGETFTNMYRPFLFLIPGILSYSVIHLLAAYFGGKKVLSIGFWGNVLTLTIIVVGDIVFIPAYGIIAAAIVSSTGYLFLMVFMIYAHSREYNSRFTDFLIFKRSDWHLLKKTTIQSLGLQKINEA